MGWRCPRLGRGWGVHPVPFNNVTIVITSVGVDPGPQQSFSSQKLRLGFVKN